jgi:hypothetical protein
MAFPISGAGTTPPLYPVNGTPNALQATGFIPEIWSGKLVEKFYASTVLSAISNTDYQGEIANQGDKVIIRTKPTIAIKKYLADGDLEIDRPNGDRLELLIDRGKYFNLILDDVMEVQSDLNILSMWSDDAAEQFKLHVDTDVLANMVDKAAAQNMGVTAGAMSGTINLGTVGAPLATVGRDPAAGQVEILDVLLRMGQAMDEQNIPETGRWVVMPTWAATQIKRSELRQAYLSGDSITMLRNGRLGMVDRFTLYVSNLLPTAATPSDVFDGGSNPLSAGTNVIYAGHAHGLTFASQFTKLETIRSERTFGTLLRGLQVYGYKVIDGKALVQAVVTQGGA